MIDPELNRIISKSRINLYESCPHAFKLSYIDKVAGKKTYHLSRGSDLHELLDDYYSMKWEDFFCHYLFDRYEPQIRLFLKSELSKTVPAHHELPLIHRDAGLRGVVDRVDISGGEVVITDYKSGKMKDLSSFRFELSLYAILFWVVHGVEPTHWGIYFIDHGVFVREKIDWDVMRDSLFKVNSFKHSVDCSLFPKKPKYGCRYCQFYKAGCDGFKK